MSNASAREVWPQGWHPQARRIDSPNFGLRPTGTPVDLAVIHSISLPPGVYGGDEIERLFTNRLDWNAHPYFQKIRGAEVSSHFVIRRDGELLQFVSSHDRAWHAGHSSWQGRDNCNDYSLGIELEGLEDLPFELAQYTALAQLLQQARQVHPIKQVAGHEHVAPGRKRDPGKAFEWAALKTLLGWEPSCFPGVITRT